MEIFTSTAALALKETLEDVDVDGAEGYATATLPISLWYDTTDPADG